MTVKVFITIDTEEDLWGDKKSRFDNPVRNVESIPMLQEIFNRYDAVPTYFVNYPVVTNKRAVSILDRIFSAGKCDIGTHCHPWNTPPYEEELTPANTMLTNLSEDLVLTKLKNLHDAIKLNFGYAPTTFRAGRWAFNSILVKCLLELGYLVDSSVTATVNWRKIYGPDYSDSGCVPYYLEAVGSTGKTGKLLEVPVTIGYLQKDFERCKKVADFISNTFLSRLKLLGLLDKVGLLNKRWLSPEVCTETEMIRLAKNWVEQGAQCLNVPFHSNCLMPGITPFVKTQKDLRRFLNTIIKFLSFCRENNWDIVPIKTAADMSKQLFDKTICFN